MQENSYPYFLSELIGANVIDFGKCGFIVFAPKYCRQVGIHKASIRRRSNSRSLRPEQRESPRLETRVGIMGLQPLCKPTAAFERHIYAQLICDGFHISRPVVLATYKMFGADRMTLISDSIRSAGLPDGEYESGGQRVFLKDGGHTFMTEPQPAAAQPFLTVLRPLSDSVFPLRKQKELLPLTGYIHGGCSPVEMKKPFRTVIDGTAKPLERFFVNAGKVGVQIKVSPTALAGFIGADFGYITVKRRKRLNKNQS